ncbi:hypothetical protein SK128_023299, partial [Halocaridina rubra]
MLDLLTTILPNSPLPLKTAHLATLQSGFVNKTYISETDEDEEEEASGCEVLDDTTDVIYATDDDGEDSGQDDKDFNNAFIPSHPSSPFKNSVNVVSSTPTPISNRCTSIGASSIYDDDLPLGKGELHRKTQLTRDLDSIDSSPSHQASFTRKSTKKVICSDDDSQDDDSEDLLFDPKRYRQKVNRILSDDEDYASTEIVGFSRSKLAESFNDSAKSLDSSKGKIFIKEQAGGAYSDKGNTACLSPIKNRDESSEDNSISCVDSVLSLNDDPKELLDIDDTSFVSNASPELRSKIMSPQEKYGHKFKIKKKTPVKMERLDHLDESVSESKSYIDSSLSQCSKSPEKCDTNDGHESSFVLSDLTPTAMKMMLKEKKTILRVADLSYLPDSGSKLRSQIKELENALANVSLDDTE